MKKRQNQKIFFSTLNNVNNDNSKFLVEFGRNFF